jgi:hypothetical protein
MSESTDGILAYGYNLGGEEDGWQIAEAGEGGWDWAPEWYDTENEDFPDGFVAAAWSELLVATGLMTEADWDADDRYERQEAAKKRLGVEFVTFCSDSAPMYVLAAHEVTAARGHVQEIDFADLDRQRVAGDWDVKLDRAIKALGVTPKQDRPAWLLVSYGDGF